MQALDLFDARRSPRERRMGASSRRARGPISAIGCRQPPTSGRDGSVAPEAGALSGSATLPQEGNDGVLHLRAKRLRRRNLGLRQYAAPDGKPLGELTLRGGAGLVGGHRPTEASARRSASDVPWSPKSAGTPAGRSPWASPTHPIAFVAREARARALAIRLGVRAVRHAVFAVPAIRRGVAAPRAVTPRAGRGAGRWG